MASGYHVGQHSFREKNGNENITKHYFSFLLFLLKLSSTQSPKLFFLKKRNLYKVMLFTKRAKPSSTLFS